MQAMEIYGGARGAGKAAPSQPPILKSTEDFPSAQVITEVAKPPRPHQMFRPGNLPGGMNRKHRRAAAKQLRQATRRGSRI